MIPTKAKRTLPLLASFAAIGIIGNLPAGAPDENHGIAYTGAIPYRGSVAHALADSAKGATIPMANYTFTASKDGQKYTDTIAGQSPFAPKLARKAINVVIVPVIVTIGSTTFDPTVADSCIAGSLSPLAAFQDSPVLQKVAFDGGTGAGHASKINGIDVGTTTYPDAFRRAEFWHFVHGKPYHTEFHVTTASPWTIDAATVKSLGGGRVISTKCAPLGVLSTSAFSTYIQDTVIPAISAITPNTFAYLLMKDVVSTTSTSLNCIDGCLIGYHSAFGSPVQTYAITEYDTTGGFWNSPGITDISIPTHEFGEWMDDPLVSNPTPPWGNIGQVSGCQSNWEVGDPLSGTDFPAIPMSNGVTYHPQELAFWGWYYKADGKPSGGTGDKFSSNGTFSGPSKVCPPGGTN